MASGLPDFYRGIDIAYQALGEVTNRPKYGGAVVSLFGGPVAASNLTELLSVLGKGMFYGGVLYLEYTSTQRDSKIHVLIDGTSLIDPTFNDLNKFSIDKPGKYPVAINKYDDVSFVYSLSLPNKITFEESVVISYVEAHGGTPTVVARLIYALI